MPKINLEEKVLISFKLPQQFFFASKNCISNSWNSKIAFGEPGSRFPKVFLPWMYLPSFSVSVFWWPMYSSFKVTTFDRAIAQLSPFSWQMLVPDCQASRNRRRETSTNALDARPRETVLAFRSQNRQQWKHSIGFRLDLEQVRLDYWDADVVGMMDPAKSDFVSLLYQLGFY